jgi:hypothetical protein
MGKTIYCISNGSPDIFPNNTLTSFGNQFPFMYDYGQASSSFNFQVAVDAIGFSLKFNQQFLPDPMNEPCMIFEYETERNIPSKGVVLKNNIIEPISFPSTNTFIEEANKKNMIKVSHKYIHFENSTLNIQNLTKLFDTVTDVIKISVDSDSNTVVCKFHYKEVKIYINSLLVPFVKVSVPKLKIEQIPTTNINNNTYEIYTCKNNYPISLDFNGVFSLNLPKIIKVKCKNIRDQIYNSSHEKDLIVFCPQINTLIDEKSTYFFHEFESRTYCTLENTILDHITFDLVNEFNEALHLDIGVPTLLKLDVNAMEKSKKAFNIRIASDLVNRSKFTIRLPQTLHFDEHWRVSLSSINLPNTFNTFNTNDDHINIIYKYQVGGFKWGHTGAFVSDGILELKIPNRVYTKKELLDLINLFLQKNELGINIGELTEVVTPGQQKTTLKLVLKSHGLLGFPVHFLDLFGKCKQEFTIDEHNYVYFFHGHQAIEAVNPSASKSTYEFEGPINIDYFKPSYIMLYSDIIQPVAVSGVYMNVMKIFPTSPLKMPYVIKEFKNIDYLSLTNHDIKEMSFQLRNHAGELISFDKDNHNPVILNLHFSNYTN